MIVDIMRVSHLADFFYSDPNPLNGLDPVGQIETDPRHC